MDHRQGTRYIDYARERTDGRAASSLVEHYPQAASFERMYRETMTGAGAAEAPPVLA